MTGGHGGGCDMERLWMPLGGFGFEAAISGPGRSESRVLDPSIHRRAGPWPRSQKQGREEEKGGLQAQARGRCVCVCVCVCGCKGPGDGHVTDARKKRCGRLDGNALASEARTAMAGLEEKRRW